MQLTSWVSALVELPVRSVRRDKIAVVAVVAMTYIIIVSRSHRCRVMSTGNAALLGHLHTPRLQRSKSFVYDYLPSEFDFSRSLSLSC